MNQLLKLRGQDAEDVQVISAVLQDAIVPFCDISFQTDDKTFVMVAQRLRREAADANGCERICCALSVRGVSEVKTQGFDRHQKDLMLDLLAIILEPSSVLNLVFANNARIRLVLLQWSLVAEDFGDTWPAMCNPCHDETGLK